MIMLNNKKVVTIGVCGSIAAYKVLEVVSKLKKQNIDVFVIMTSNATKLISPLSFQAMSQNPVIIDFFNYSRLGNVPHIDLERITDVFLIAPGTANIIGKIASGIGDDALSTFALSCTSFILIAPAMNTRMWNNKIVQENLNKLKDLGYVIIPPEFGLLACGEEGEGKLAQVDDIVSAVNFYLHKSKTLSQKNILITAGPTYEQIDPIRFISNYSSGKMGYALAEKSAQRGAKVSLVSGPSLLPCPYNVNLIKVSSSEEMHREVLKHFEASDVIISAAAVLDFKPKKVGEHKIKTKNISMEFISTVDILSELGKIKKLKQVLVGFAAESENLVENAKEKLKKKNLDMIVANNIIKDRMGSDENEVCIIYKDGKIEKLPRMSKTQLADEILSRLEKI